MKNTVLFAIVVSLTSSCGTFTNSINEATATKILGTLDTTDQVTSGILDLMQHGPNTTISSQPNTYSIISTKKNLTVVTIFTEESSEEDPFGDEIEMLTTDIDDSEDYIATIRLEENPRVLVEYTLQRQLETEANGGAGGLSGEAKAEVNSLYQYQIMKMGDFNFPQNHVAHARKTDSDYFENFVANVLVNKAMDVANSRINSNVNAVDVNDLGIDWSDYRVITAGTLYQIQEQKITVSNSKIFLGKGDYYSVANRLYNKDGVALRFYRVAYTHEPLMPTGNNYAIAYKAAQNAAQRYLLNGESENFDQLVNSINGVYGTDLPDYEVASNTLNLTPDPGSQSLTASQSAEFQEIFQIQLDESTAIEF